MDFDLCAFGGRSPSASSYSREAFSTVDAHQLPLREEPISPADKQHDPESLRSGFCLHLSSRRGSCRICPGLGVDVHRRAGLRHPAFTQTLEEATRGPVPEKDKRSGTGSMVLQLG